MEDIYTRLKELEEQHVRAVRGLEKLAKAIDHVRAARGELDGLIGDENLSPGLSDIPEQLKGAEDALAEQTWRVRAYISDVELDQNHLQRRLRGQQGEEPAAR